MMPVKHIYIQDMAARDEHAQPLQSGHAIDHRDQCLCAALTTLFCFQVVKLAWWSIHRCPHKAAKDCLPNTRASCSYTERFLLCREQQREPGVKADTHVLLSSPGILSHHMQPWCGATLLCAHPRVKSSRPSQQILCSAPMDYSVLQVCCTS